MMKIAATISIALLAATTMGCVVDAACEGEECDVDAEVSAAEVVDLEAGLEQDASQTGNEFVVEYELNNGAYDAVTNANIKYNNTDPSYGAWGIIELRTHQGEAASAINDEMNDQ